MRKGIFLYRIMLVVCAMACFVSCTHDIDIPNNATEEINEKRGPRADIGKTMEVLIEFKQGTAEYVKRKIRSNYTDTGLLLDWEKCEIKDNDQVEVWILNFEIYAAYRPAPLNDPDKEDMERVTLNANCKDYKED